MFHVPAREFALDHTLASGQLFRYAPVDEGFLISHADKAFVISQDGDALIIHAATPNVTSEWVTKFFALDTRAPEPVDDFSRRALEYCGGLRVCRQDAWECTIGFITSQNNNIKRIRAIMEGLASSFGEKVTIATSTRKYEAYLFPEPRQITPGAKLDALRMGYRDKYLLAASDTLSHEWLDSVRELSYETAKESLLNVQGIGPKVAECILLFGYGHTNAFPKDTWVQQFMKEEYGCETLDEMERVAQEKFGKNAGLIQQYLFHYRRNTKGVQ